MQPDGTYRPASLPSNSAALSWSSNAQNDISIYYVFELQF